MALLTPDAEVLALVYSAEVAVAALIVFDPT